MALIGVDERQLYGFLMYYLTIWDLVYNYLVFQGLPNYRYEYNRYILHTHTHTHTHAHAHAHAHTHTLQI